MSLEYNVRKPENLEKIKSNDYGELLWWSYISSTTPEKILTTIDKVGNSTQEVKKHVKS